MKKRFIIMLCLMVFSASIFAQTASLEQVPRTGIFIKPPKGFTESKRFSGFEQVATKSSLIVMPLKDVSLDDVGQQMFSESQLQKQNMTMLGREDMLINGQMIGLVFLQQNTTAGVVEKIVRLIEGDHELVILNGIYLINQKDQVYDALRDAIISAEWRHMPAPEDFDLVDFEFNVTPGWEIREPGNLGKMINLSLTGAPQHSTPADWPVIIVAPSLDSTEISSLRSKNIELLKSVKYYDFDSIKSEQSREINGLKAYLIKSKGTDSETSEPLDCWQILIRGRDNKGYYRVLALGSDLEFDAKALFDSLMATFTLK